MILRIVLALLIALYPSTLWAAVAYDNSATNTITGTTNTITVSMTASGTNRLVLCGVHYNDVMAVSSVSYGGSAMTQSTAGQVQTGGFSVDVWYLIAPATGAQTVTATLASTGAHKILSCISFTGVDQTTPFGTCATYSGFDNPSTVTISVSASGMGAMFETNGDATNATLYTVDGSSTKRFDLASANTDFAAIGSTTASTGSVTQTVSNPLPHYASMIGCPLNQSITVTPGVARRLIVVE